MKKGLNKGVVFAVCFITVFVAFLILLITMLKMSNDLREFKVDLFVLCNESDICIAESEEGKFRITRENQLALNALATSTRGYFTTGEPEVTEAIHWEFDHNKEKWYLTIGRAGENRLMVELDGPRHYKVYIKENHKFPEIQKTVSAKGYHEANKPIGNN